MVNYPGQDEAQAVVDWFKGMNNVYLGSCEVSDQLREAFEKAESIRRSEWERIFGDNSPWNHKGNGKSLSLVWDDDKAKRLGID